MLGRMHHGAHPPACRAGAIRTTCPKAARCAGWTAGMACCMDPTAPSPPGIGSRRPASCAAAASAATPAPTPTLPLHHRRRRRPRPGQPPAPLAPAGAGRAHKHALATVARQAHTWVAGAVAADVVAATHSTQGRPCLCSAAPPSQAPPRLPPPWQGATHPGMSRTLLCQVSLHGRQLLGSCRRLCRHAGRLLLQRHHRQALGHQLRLGRRGGGRGGAGGWGARKERRQGLE